MDKFDIPAKQILEALEIMSLAIGGEPRELSSIKQVEEKMRPIVLFEPNVEVASLFAKALMGIMLCYPGNERKGENFKHLVDEYYTSVQEMIENLSPKAKEIIQWN